MRSAPGGSAGRLRLLPDAGGHPVFLDRHPCRRQQLFRRAARSRHRTRVPDRAGQLRRVGAPRGAFARVPAQPEALAVNAVYLRAAFAASRHGSGDSARLEALRVAAGRASVRAEQTLQQGHSALATDMSTHYQRLHADTRRLAALAGLVRTRVEATPRATRSGHAIDGGAGRGKAGQTGHPPWRQRYGHALFPRPASTPSCWSRRPTPSPISPRRMTP